MAINKYCKNDYIETYMGKKFSVMFPDPEDVCIEDIAHSLSLQCRYTGHCKRFYSVAEHSIHVANLCENNPFGGLMHDGSESYITDVPSPIKPFLTNYKELEQNVMDVLIEKFKISTDFDDEIHTADVYMLLIEAKDMMRTGAKEWKVAQKIDKALIPDVQLHYWTPEVAEEKFLEKFEILYTNHMMELEKIKNGT